MPRTARCSGIELRRQQRKHPSGQRRWHIPAGRELQLHLWHLHRSRRLTGPAPACSGRCRDAAILGEI